MSANFRTGVRPPDSVLELKTRNLTLPTLRLLGTDMDRVAATLSEKVSQAPDFFRNTPVVIDLQGLAEDTDVSVDFPLLVGLLRGYGMIPVGVLGGTPAHQESANLMELALLSSARPRSRSQAPAPPAAKVEPPPAPAATGLGKLVDRPVRSGQRVYAPGGDLIVTAPVSAGAELLADGNIHVYGPLRGRALAGVKGNTETRIFCQNLQAELVSVAGHYRVSENLRPEDTGRPVQIYLRERTLIIEAL